MFNIKSKLCLKKQGFYERSHIPYKKILNKIASLSGGRKNTNDEKNLFRVH
ncbi:hypothetical protein QE422_001191 [Chryseobacterium sp. SORGH_AS 447]|nr:hypothetical protein [Chryseobacterium sp. SORGH_AS_0447]